MKLYNFKNSPNPLKVRLALAELNQPYTQEKINLFKSEHLTGGFRAINPFQAVPVLEDGKMNLRESNAILSYLGRKFGGALWPKTLGEEATALQWLFFESFSLSGQCGRIWWSDIVSKALPVPTYSEDTLRDTMESLSHSLEVLEEHLSKNHYILGDHFSLVDCSVGVTSGLLRETRLDELKGLPHLKRYITRIRNRPSWVEAEGDATHQIRR